MRVTAAAEGARRSPRKSPVVPMLYQARRDHVVNAVLLQPLPYSHPERLIRVYTEFPTFPNGGLHRFWTSGSGIPGPPAGIRFLGVIDAWITGCDLAGKTQPVFAYCRIPERRIAETVGVAHGCRGADITKRRCPERKWLPIFPMAPGKLFFAGDPNVVGRRPTSTA